VTLRVLSLFAGIGGFDLGLERTGGFKTVAFCEIEPFAQRVLAKHWPGVPCYDDVRTLTAERLGADGISVDVIAGGFPCQDISVAGRGAGIGGERSGLWGEYARLVGELRPAYVIVENVAALLGRGLGTVLGDLAALGFDAEWHCIPASAVGAPHRRDRVWIVAHPNRRHGRKPNCAVERGRAVVEAVSCRAPPSCGDREPRADVADADLAGLSDWRQARQQARENEAVWRLALAQSERCGRAWWTTEPDVGRVVDGLPGRVDRLRCLGNAVVPAIPEMIGRAILAAEAAA
jgi:DNA (cytosine-5)-methyltransferase 1